MEHRRRLSPRSRLYLIRKVAQWRFEQGSFARPPTFEEQREFDRVAEQAGAMHVFRTRYPGR